MKDKTFHVSNRNNVRMSNVLGGKDRLPEVMAMKQEIDRLKKQISEMQLANKIKWSNSAVEVIFKDEGFSKKYKSSIESFLTNLLDGEPFLVDYRISQLQEYAEELNQSFCIDKKHHGDTSQNRSLPQTVPAYSTSFEEILHIVEPNADTNEKQEPDEKCQTVTCFNCLGNHHMKNCPNELDRLKIAANRKDYQTNSSRYHEEEQLNSTMKPGCISDSLREALGLNRYQIPLYVYHMRVLGYPPGWMKEAEFETSGLFLYDSNGKAIADDCIPASTNGTKFDGTKFVDYPGFNTPVPRGFKDEWQELNMPPIQKHQQLSEALRSPNTIIGSNLYKKRMSEGQCNGEFKKSRMAQEDFNGSCSDWKPLQESTPNRNSVGYRNTASRSRTGNSSIHHSSSLSVSPGTPIMAQGNPFTRLPNSDKFAQGISEHMPFENLPDAVGTFEKMRGVLSTLHEKQSMITNGKS